MKSRSTGGLYFLLMLYAAISMTYYVAGVVALHQEFFHAARYAREPFNLDDYDGRSLKDIRKEAQDAGLFNGDSLLDIDGVPFTGYVQIHELVRHANPGQAVEVTVRAPHGPPREAHFRLAPGEGPDFSIGGLIAFLTPILGVPLLGLIVGYWVVAARPRDLNAWLVLFLLTFPEISYGNLDWNHWPGPWNLLLGCWNLLIGLFFVFPALLWFGLLFPERWRLDLRWPWLKYVILTAITTVSLVEVRIMIAQYFSVQVLPGLRQVQIWADRLTSWLQILCVLLFLAALFDKLRSTSSADAKRRLRVLAIGSGLSFGPLLIIFIAVPLFGMDPRRGNWFIAIIPFLALFPLTLGYVLIVQRAMDLRILLRMGTKYLLARATLFTLEITVVAFLLFRFIVPMMQRKEHPILNIVLLGVCIAVLFQVFILRGSLSQRLQAWLDRKFFREAYNSEVILSELSSQVSQLTDKTDLIDTVLLRISEVLHVSHIAILLRGSNVFNLQQSLGMNVTGPVALSEQSATIRNLIRTKEPATVYPDRPEEWFEEADASERSLLHQINAELLLPLPGRSRLMGLMALGPKRSEEPYTPTDMRTLQSVAAQTGLTLEIAELVQTLADESAQRQRMGREIEIAREVQQRLFPQNIPAIPGVTLAGSCRPASEVGGDYYDLIHLENGSLVFTIGDVSGKGISAALIMASLRASLHGLVLDDPGDLARLLQKINRLVYEASSSSRYATFFFSIYDPRTRELRYVNAGHNPPVLIKASGELHRLEANGPVVGLLPEVFYEAQSLTMEPGDVLLAYTDGISEAMTIEDEEWGEARMLEATPRNPHTPAAEMIGEIFIAADTFTAGAEQHDDMTLLAMKLMKS